MMPLNHLKPVYKNWKHRWLPYLLLANVTHLGKLLLLVGSPRSEEEVIEIEVVSEEEVGAETNGEVGIIGEFLKDPGSKEGVVVITVPEGGQQVLAFVVMILAIG